MRGRTQLLPRVMFTLAATITLAAAATVTAAPPAQALAADCIFYLNSAGYSGPAISAACHHGEFDFNACLQRLALQNVPAGIASRACYFARF